MARYGPIAKEKVDGAMHEMKEGSLTSGRSDKRVKSRAQAIAIGLSEARKEGGKVPKKSAAKPVAKKATEKKTPAKKTVAKKAADTKAPARKASARTAPKK
jgi:topoisomerase IA-like protein